MWLKLVAIDDLFNIFFVAIIVDFITGILVAAKRGKLKSRTCSKFISNNSLINTPNIDAYLRQSY